DAGRFAEALPKFQAISEAVPEAELYVARCLVRTRGCSVAAAHLDSAATRNAGTESGSRASLEAARCYGWMGGAPAARSRSTLRAEDAYAAPEARPGLAGLDESNHSETKTTPAAAAAPPPSPTAGAHPARHASPKAAKPSAAEPPIDVMK